MTDTSRWQHPVGDVLRLLVGAVGLPDDRGLIATGFEVAVHTVRGDVERAVLEPADRDVVIGKRGVFHLRVGADPVETAALFLPEGDRVGDRGGIERLVAGRIGMCPGGDFRGGRNRSGFPRGFRASGRSWLPPPSMAPGGATKAGPRAPNCKERLKRERVNR